MILWDHLTSPLKEEKRVNKNYHMKLTSLTFKDLYFVIFFSIDSESDSADYRHDFIKSLDIRNAQALESRILNELVKVPSKIRLCL